MPFTPLHLGPGLLLKAAGGPRFSLFGFAATQVAMDIEPLLHVLRDDPVLHGWTHSYAGALGVGALVLVLLVLGWPWWRRGWPERWARRAGLPALPATAPRWALASGVLLGALSHVALDAIMHADLHPLWPFSPAQPGHALVGIDTLHLACVLAGLAGGILLGWRDRLARRGG